MTFSPFGASTTITSDHAKIPVVSRSQPPLHVKPVKGLSSGPSQSVEP